MNVCGAVQYINTAAPELQLIECVLLQDTMNDSFSKADRGDIFNILTHLLAKWVPYKQDFIVVPPPSNIMEVKKKKNYDRGQNRTLIKCNSNLIVLFT